MLLLLLVLQNLVFVIVEKSLEVSDFDRFDPTKGGVSVAVELDHWAVAFSRFSVINYCLAVPVSCLFA